MPSNFSQILGWCFQDFGFSAQPNTYSENYVMLEKPLSVISYTVFKGGWSSIASNLDEVQQCMGHQFEWEAGEEGMEVLTRCVNHSEVQGVFFSLFKFTSKTWVKQTVPGIRK